MPAPDSREYWSAITVVAEQNLLVAESIRGIAQHVHCNVNVGLFLFWSQYSKFGGEINRLGIAVVAARHDEIFAVHYFYMLAVGRQCAQVVGLRFHRDHPSCRQPSLDGCSEVLDANDVGRRIVFLT